MLSSSKSRTIMIFVILIAASLVGGAFLGYRSGFTSSNSQSSDIQKYANDIQRLTELNANITIENEVLRSVASGIAGKTLKIGYIAPETSTYTLTKPFIEQVVQPDINAYASSLGQDVSFEFVIKDSQGQANKHLELVQELHNDGVDIFIGAGWSSQGCAALSYVNSHKMIMLSPSSTSRTSAISNDRFYRLCPADTAFAPAIADIAWSYGIRELVIIQRGDSYGDGIVIQLRPIFAEKGGNVAQVVRYPAEATEFCDYLKEARTIGEAAIARMGGDTSKVGVLLIAFDEAHQILKQVSQCEILYNLVWFGSDSTAKSDLIMSNSPLEANHLKVISPRPQTPDSTKYTDLEARYIATTGKAFDIYGAYLNDAAWVLAKSILETGSYNATEVANVLPSVCENFYGASGWCRLNEFGDRAPPPFDIWYYTSGTMESSQSIQAGKYYPETRTVAWNIK